MELRHIRYFITLAEELNFRKAAERLHIAQPPLSRQIQELEEEIGTRLFHRTKRKVELTNAGKVFLQKAYQILNDIEQACVTTRLSSTGQEGELRIGFTGAVSDIIPVIKEYRYRYPKVGIILQHMSSTEQITALNEKRIDIANVSIPINAEHIQTMPVLKLSLMAAVPEQHPLATKPTVTIQDLADETLIMTTKSAGSLFYDTVIGLFKNAGCSPRMTIHAYDLQTVLTMVASDMGVTITPSPIFDYKGIVKRDIENVNISIFGSVAWRKDHQSELLKNYLQTMHDVLEKVEVPLYS